MHLLSLLFFCISSVWGSPLLVKNNPTPRIINGEPAKLGQFPWQVALMVNEEYIGGWFCGGSLISEQWILTAGHCVADAISALVYAGLVDLANRGVVSHAESFILHDGFNETNGANDIGLIKLAEPLDFDENTKAIALANEGEELGAGVEVVISGWGLIKDNSMSVNPLLNYITLTTISNEDCDEAYGRTGTILDEIVCTASGGGRVMSPCNGDSGGPMVTYAESSDPVHVAVVSFVSDAGCESGDPSGNIRTSLYRDWIRQHTGI